MLDYITVHDLRNNELQIWLEQIKNISLFEKDDCIIYYVDGEKHYTIVPKEKYLEVREQIKNIQGGFRRKAKRLIK